MRDVSAKWLPRTLLAMSHVDDIGPVEDTGSAGDDDPVSTTEDNDVGLAMDQTTLLVRHLDSHHGASSG